MKKRGRGRGREMRKTERGNEGKGWWNLALFQPPAQLKPGLVTRKILIQLSRIEKNFIIQITC